jgi:hypothetical protein
MIKIFLLALAGAAAAGSGAVAASAGDVSFNADKTITTLNHPARAYMPLAASSRKRTVIFDNLATLDPKGVYIADTGYTIGGPQSPIGQIWFAAAFTPAANATITEVDVAAGYIEGTKNEVLVEVYSDASGVPGTALWSHKASLPPAGDCCVVAKVKDKTGIPVKAGTQYWIAIQSAKNASDIFASWNFNDADQVDSALGAENDGSGWKAVATLPNAAFAIYGD